MAIVAILPSGTSQLDWSDHYFEAIGIWPCPAWVSNTKDFFVQEVISDPKSRLLPEPEMIDGASCLVIERGEKDKLWLDPDKGFMLRHRVRLTRNKTSGNARRQVYHLADFRAVGGVWLPFFSQQTQEHSRSTHEDRFVPTIINQILVGEVHINDFATDDLRPMFSPGTVVEDAASGEKTYVSGGENLLEQLLAEIPRVRNGNIPRGPRREPGNPLAGALWYGGGAGIVSAVFIGLLSRFRPRPGENRGERLAGDRETCEAK